MNTMNITHTIWLNAILTIGGTILAIIIVLTILDIIETWWAQRREILHAKEILQDYMQDALNGDEFAINQVTAASNELRRHGL